MYKAVQFLKFVTVSLAIFNPDLLTDFNDDKYSMSDTYVNAVRGDVITCRIALQAEGPSGQG